MKSYSLEFCSEVLAARNAGATEQEVAVRSSDTPAVPLRQNFLQRVPALGIDTGKGRLPLRDGA
jgi:hypothetical protein